VRLLDMVGTAWRARRDYDVGHIDVFSGDAFIWAEASAFALARAGKPYVLTLRGGRLPEFSRRCAGRVSRLLQGAAAVTAPSSYLVEKMRDFRQDVELLPNPIDLSCYPFRERSDITPALMWLRAFHWFYNPPLAVEALDSTRARFPEMRLTMIGPDKRDGALEAVRKTIARLGLEGRVSLRGRIPKAEVGQALSQLDVFLNTADVDNTPVSVLEAMACGMVVISTRVGGIPHLLKDGEDALLVPSRDPAAIAEAVSRVMTDRELTSRLSRNARRKAEQFDWDAILPRWKQLLSMLAAGAGRA
jgi:glycosyltransferase involved in cell wall biosynthesis